MWRWQNLVVVLTQPTDRSQPPLPVLTGLDASTGQARWTLPMGGGVGFSPTADRGLAIALAGEDGVLELELVDLPSGRVRWTRRSAQTMFRPWLWAAARCCCEQPADQL
jgi:hypothetical protein